MTIWRGPLPAENYWIGRNSRPIDRIVLHTMVGWITGTDAHFHNPASGVSAHYGIRLDGAEWQWVDEADTAYHAGDLDINRRSFGIEHEDAGHPDDPRPDVLYGASSFRIADLCRKYGIPCVRGTYDGPGIYDHRKIRATACPGALDTDRIIALAAAQLGEEVPVTDEEFLEKLYRLYAPKLERQLQLQVIGPLAELQREFDLHVHDMTIPKPVL